MCGMLETWKDEQKTTTLDLPPCISLWLLLQNIVCLSINCEKPTEIVLSLNDARTI